jgi:glucose/arabinose dehydrogenase
MIEGAMLGRIGPRPRFWRAKGALAAALAACALAPTPAPARRLPLDQIRLPPGFRIAVWAEDVPDAREMALAPDGTVFVGTRRLGNVYAVRDTDGDQKADKVYVVARGLRSPNGVAFRDGSLYVAEISRVWRFDGILNHLTNPEGPALVTKDLPPDRWHGWKFIAFGPDGWLYVPVGAPCNVCERDDPRYASILRMKPDGTGLSVFASGIRNTVGFDWDPATKDLWFTDNGRDHLGDEAPSDELDHAPRKGMNFGFPYCHGGDVPDPEFGKAHPCSDFTPPAWKFPAHVAPLGMRFYTGRMFPPEYRGSVFVAEHGSSNRTHKIGYRIEFVKIRGGRAVSASVFAEGWRQGDRNWGRPVDVLGMPDGALLVSDDDAGAIYRISYSPN